MILDGIVLLASVIIGGCYEPKTIQEEIIVFAVIGVALVFEIIRFLVWSKREERRAYWQERRAYYDIVERERRRNEQF